MASKTATRFATKVAEYLTTEKGKKNFLKEFDLEYNEWFSTWVNDNWADRKTIKSDARSRAARLALDWAVGCSDLPKEVKSTMETVTNYAPDDDFYRWQRNHVSRAKNPAPLARRIDETLARYMDDVPADWK